MPPTNTEWILRNLLTAVAAVAIIGAAGAAYFLAGDRIADEPGTTAASSSIVATGTTGAGSAAQTQTAQAGQPAVGADEHVLGKADAPVTIIEYASMTCPHCAAFHVSTLPRIKSEYVDKGLVRLVFRPFPLDRLASRASLLAQCAPAEGYFSMIDILFRSQQDWATAPDPLAALKQIGRTAGLADADIDRCMNDEKGIDQIVASMQEAQSEFGVDATPTFIVNGKKYQNMPFDDYDDAGTKKPGFGKAIQDLLPKP